MKNLNWIISDIQRLKIQELHTLKNLYMNAKKFDKAEETQDKLNSFKSFCNWATDEQILEEVKNRLTDFYQVLAGYYYTIAEDFESNPLIKIDRLKKAVICCNLLKQHCKDAEIYANKYICQQNRNYLR
jgi:hypothetical protein